jgi:O-antigen/teichoic acid export membrane protein
MRAASVKKLVTVGGVLVGARLVGAALNFLTQVLLARWMGAEELGSYVLATALGGVLAIACGVGFSAITARFVSQYRTDNQPELLLGFVHASRRTLATTSFVVVGSIVAAILLVPGLVPPPLALPLAIGAATGPALGAMRLGGALANVWRRHFLSFLPDLLWRPAMLVAAVSIIGAVTRLSASAVLLANLACVLAVTTLQAMLLWRDELVPPGTRPRETDARVWRQAGWPLVVMILLSSILIETDVLLLGPLLPRDDLAVFNMCFRLTAFVGFFVYAVYQVVTPDLSDAFARRDRATAQLAVSRANLVCVGVGILGLVCLALFGKTILGMIGPKFAGGWRTLMLLGTLQLIGAAFGPAAQLLTVGNEQNRCVIALSCGLVVLAGLNAILVPRFGLEGASLAVLLATAFWSAWLWLAARRHMGFDVSIFAPVLPLPRSTLAGKEAGTIRWPRSASS